MKIENAMLYIMMMTNRITMLLTKYSTIIELAGMTEDINVLAILVVRMIFSSR